MRSTSAEPRQLSWLHIFPVIFVAIFLLHAPLLRLPFFWDEAGFYVPAAFDLAHYHTVIPKTTLDTGHPPLPAAYLALWFTLSGWKPAVGRIAQLLLAAFALTNVFLLARRLAGTGVAVASTFATALYPIFFVQSSLAHADLAAAAFTLWGIRASAEKQIWRSQAAFSLAVLSKETAILAPFAIAIWELLGLGGKSGRRRLLSAVPFLVPLAFLLAWLGYHHSQTGRFFGDPGFYQYNVVQAITPIRFLLALGLRFWHLFGAMNMLALTAATGAAMMFPPVVDSTGERRRIPVPIQLQFALIMLAYIVVLSLLGGALLTRYLLPVYPLVIIIGMSTLHRRIVSWEWPAAVMVVFFVFALAFDPPYRIAPEDNLTYRDFIELHAAAAHFLEQHERGKTVLTAWPATDELTKPYLGYVQQPFATIPVRDFTATEMLRARGMRSRYQVAYLFSTKYEGSTWFHSELWDRLNQRYFDYHRDLSPEACAQVLGGKVVYLARKKAEWVEIIEMEQTGSFAMSRHRVIVPGNPVREVAPQQEKRRGPQPRLLAAHPENKQIRKKSESSSRAWAGYKRENTRPSQRLPQPGS
ncbi:MAG TPA: glycosyltransferase family 39 protein [Candidatus Angelobacter sp.]|nr:glycosyltransferase family 39 protein [Candidatus Angelobacter sp.]